MNATYPSPVESLSAEELKVLSAELEEAFCSESRDGDTWWCDEDAEHRYDAMKAEEWRRFLLANPDYVPPKASELVSMMTRDALNYLQNNVALTRSISDRFHTEFAGIKVGQSISIRKPAKFLAQG